jgi:hypothetical protein
VRILSPVVFSMAREEGRAGTTRHGIFPLAIPFEAHASVTVTHGRPCVTVAATNKKQNFRARKEAETWAAQLHGELQSVHAPLLGGPARATVSRTLLSTRISTPFTSAAQIRKSISSTVTLPLLAGDAATSGHGTGWHRADRCAASRGPAVKLRRSARPARRRSTNLTLPSRALPCVRPPSNDPRPALTLLPRESRQHHPILDP